MNDYAWIMLTKKLPTIVSPPRMSIHFSEPWPHGTAQEKTTAQHKAMHEIGIGIFGFEHDWSNARAIFFRGERIRVFPDEFSILSADRMSEYSKDSHMLIEEDVTGKTVTEAISLRGTRKTIYEAALLDGCNHYEALMVASGSDLKGGLMPPIGWWKIRDEYGLIFCSSRELEITDRRNEHKGMN